MEIKTFFSDYYRPLRLRGRSINTTRLYGCTIRAFGKWLGYEPTLDDLTDLTISRFLEHRATYRSPYTAEKERTQLLAIWRFAADRGLLKDRPCVPPAPLPEQVPQAWSVDQLQALMRAAAASRGYIGAVRAAVWWPALIAVLWETAERISAVLACTPDDFSPPYLTVRAAYRKGNKRDRVYRLSTETCEMIAAAAASAHLFHWAQNHGYLWKRYKDVVARAGLGHGRKTAFHQLRRSAASHYAARGGDATKLLDHSSPRITQRWYLDSRLVDREPPPFEVLPRIN